jgi:putative FmdB family regulatory protein
MPLYDFKCSECGTVFEENHSFETKKVGCKFCGGIAERTALQISRFDYRIKGDNSASTRPKDGASRKRTDS